MWTDGCTDGQTDMTELTVSFQNFVNAPVNYEGWNFNSGNYLFTTDTK